MQKFVIVSVAALVVLTAYGALQPVSLPGIYFWYFMAWVQQ